MTFAHPWWLMAGFLVGCGFPWAWRAYDRRQSAALAQFVAAHLRSRLTRSVSLPRRRVRRGLFAASIALLCIALAGPEAGYRMEQVQGRGNDIVFAVDTSRSMLTPDVKPDRLARAKLAIEDFVNRLDGDAVGLIAFAGSAFLQCPVTFDYSAFRETLNTLDTHIIPRGGTNITSAIREAQAALQRRPGSDKVLILVTDGEDLEGDAVATAKAAAREDGLKIYTVGVGTASGDLIPLPADQGGGFLKDASGNLVRSRLDEETLKQIASVTGGFYTPLGAEGQGLGAIYQKALAPLAKHELAARQQRVNIERFQWPLAAALLTLIASLLIGSRRLRPSPVPAKLGQQILGPVARSGVAVALVPLLGLLCVHSLHASPASAKKAYDRGDFITAERDYSTAAQRAPNKPVLQFNLGAAAYKAGEFKHAAQAFQTSLTAAPSADAKRLAQQQDAYYNLGNTLYRVGQKTERTAPQDTIQTWTQAVKAYDVALQLRRNDADSKFNRDLVNRKIAALKKQSEQNQQKQTGGQSPKPKQQPQSGSSKPTQQNSAQTSQQKGQSQGDAPKPGQQGSPQTAQQQAQPQSGSPKSAGQNSAQSSQQKGQWRGDAPKPGQQGSPQTAQSQAQPQSEQASNGKNQQQPGQQAMQSASQPEGPQKESKDGATQSSAATAQQPQPDRATSQGIETAQAADNQHLPGQMSREEARELLDSVKDEERRLPSAPLARTYQIPPDRLAKDW